MRGKQNPLSNPGQRLVNKKIIGKVTQVKSQPFDLITFGQKARKFADKAGYDLEEDGLEVWYHKPTKICFGSAGDWAEGDATILRDLLRDLPEVAACDIESETDPTQVATMIIAKVPTKLIHNNLNKPWNGARSDQIRDIIKAYGIEKAEDEADELSLRDFSNVGGWVQVPLNK